MKTNFFQGRAIVAASLALFTLASCNVVLSSCEKDKKEDLTPTPNPGPTLPVVTINAPSVGGEVDPGDSIAVNVTFQSADLHEWQVAYVEKATGDTLRVEGDHTHDKTYTYAGHFVNNLADHGDVRLIATATDHGGQIKTVERSFHCHH